ncbi:MAG: mechanosensitive ion channel [Rickettsiales bacterium]|nr:mechanosensitive ion channel [Rickettsiales bacterium]
MTKLKNIILCCKKNVKKLTYKDFLVFSVLYLGVVAPMLFTWLSLEFSMLLTFIWIGIIWLVVPRTLQNFYPTIKIQEASLFDLTDINKPQSKIATLQLIIFGLFIGFSDITLKSTLKLGIFTLLLPIAGLILFWMSNITIKFIINCEKKSANNATMNSNGKLQLSKMAIEAVNFCYNLLLILFFLLLPLFFIEHDSIKNFLMVAWGLMALVTFASQKFFAHFWSGLIIFINRPFWIGDRITISNPDPQKYKEFTTGIVKDISWQMTKIKFGNIDISLTNSVVTKMAIANYKNEQAITETQKDVAQKSESPKELETIAD